MTKLVVDSWAWMEYFEGSPVGGRVRDKIIDERNEVFTHVVSIAQIVSKVRRRGKDVDTAWKAITTISKITKLDEIDSKEAGLLHAKIKSKNPNFGLADAFVLSAARKLKAKVLTGDPDFKGMDDAIFVS
jgi:predicted nucleic acid-binding protein